MYFIYNNVFVKISSFIFCPSDKFHIPNSTSSTVNANNPKINAGTSILPFMFTVRSKLTVKYRIGLPFGTPTSHIISLPQINERCYEPQLASWLDRHVVISDCVGLKWWNVQYIKFYESLDTCLKIWKATATHKFAHTGFLKHYIFP